MLPSAKMVGAIPPAPSNPAGCPDDLLRIVENRPTVTYLLDHMHTPVHSHVCPVNM